MGEGIFGCHFADPVNLRCVEVTQYQKVRGGVCPNEKFKVEDKRGVVLLGGGRLTANDTEHERVRLPKGNG